MKGIQLLLIATLFTVFACGTSESKKKRESLYQSTLMVHDSARAVLDQVQLLERQANALRKDARESGQDTECYEAPLQELRDANDAYQTWMRSFEMEEIDKLDDEAYTQYLNNESQKLQEIRKQMENAVASGEVIVKFESCIAFERKILFDEVMYVHDEVMPKMGEINQLEGVLAKLKDEKPKDAKCLDGAIANLKDADRSMMNWMRNFKRNEIDTMSDEDYFEYMNEERRRVQVVNDKIKSSLTEARKIRENEGC
ncbi:MAG: hypothetical protein LAT68_11830 [Cyclobacteriaceae bacterium]|nr:hypothetical protein [Cyclobacteriaceae bacterium]MCH8517006.1 hypothetical protein [Cyclobacteriaceae bacterium]